MSERDLIFRRIREAERMTTPVPGAGHGDTAQQAAAVTPDDHRRVLPAVGETLEARLALFLKNAAELRADFQRFPSQAECLDALKRLREAAGWERVASHHGPLTNAACAALGLPVLWTDAPYDPHELERCPVGITGCDALVAQTGSVLVTTRSAGGRALSVLPPHHVVLARVDQLVATLPDAFALLTRTYGANYPSMISFITGPSRTGDIERILVLGAHGPKQLTIFCIA